MRIFILLLLFLCLSCSNDPSAPGSEVILGREIESYLPMRSLGLKAESSQLLLKYNDNEYVVKGRPFSARRFLRGQLLSLARDELSNSVLTHKELKIPFHLFLDQLFWFDDQVSELVMQENLNDLKRYKYIDEVSFAGDFKLEAKSEKGVFSGAIVAPEVTLYSFERRRSQLNALNTFHVKRDEENELTLDFERQDSAEQKLLSLNIKDIKLSDDYWRGRRKLVWGLSDYSLIDEYGIRTRASKIWNEHLEEHALVIFSTEEDERFFFIPYQMTVREFIEKEFTYYEEGDSFLATKLNQYWNEVRKDLDWSEVQPELFEKYTLHFLNGTDLNTKLIPGNTYSIVHSKVKDVLLAKSRWDEDTSSLLKKDTYHSLRAYKQQDLLSKKVVKPLVFDFVQCVPFVTSDFGEQCFEHVGETQGVFRSIHKDHPERINFDKATLGKSLEAFSLMNGFSDVALFKPGMSEDPEFPMRSLGRQKVGLLELKHPSVLKYPYIKFKEDISSRIVDLKERIFLKKLERSLVPDYD